MILDYPFDFPTIEHLQGYLFSQQSVANEIGASPGGMYEFQINTIQNTENIPLKELIVNKIISNTNAQNLIVQNQKELLNVFAEFDKVINTEVRFLEVMDRWFIDKYLILSRHFDKLVNQVELSEIDSFQKEGQIADLKKSSESIQHRIDAKKPFSLYFYHAILYFMGHDFDCYEFKIPKELKSDPDYPNGMYFTLGWEFNILVFKNETKTLFIHLGFVLT